MRFWDTSALVPLLVEEPATPALLAQHRADPVVVVAWTTVVECGSALARAERDALLDEAAVAAAFDALDALARTWVEVEPSNELRDIARRLLRVHRIRAADAIQLAAATLAAERRPSTLTVVTLDDRLEAAARREGFVVVRPL